MKRIVCVICAVFVLLTLSISILADEPRNNVRGSLVISSCDSYIDSTPLSIDFNDVSISFGTSTLFDVFYRPGDGETWYSDLTVLHGSFSLEVLEPCTLYLCVNDSDDSSISYSNDSSLLMNYRDSDNDFSSTVTVSDPYIALGIQSTTGGYVLSQSANALYGTTYNVSYQAFKDVPAGIYNLYFSYSRATAAPTYNAYFMLGVYAVGVSPVDDYINGNITFDDALDKVITNMQTQLDQILTADVVDYNQAQFVLNYAQYEIQRIEYVSDIKYNSTVSNFNDSGDQIVNSYVQSGSTDPTPYIDQLSMSFTDALSQAVTPEQGSFLSSIFQNLLAKLQLNFDIAYKKELDDVVSDEEMDNNQVKLDIIDTLFSGDHEARDLFQQSEYENLLNFQDWLDALGDASNYRNLFNFFFNDSGYIKYFLTIPLSLVLVSLVLGTTTSVFRGYHREQRYRKINQSMKEK